MFDNKIIKSNLRIVKPDDCAVEQYYYLTYCETILKQNNERVLTVYNFDKVVRVADNINKETKYFRKQNDTSIPEEALDYLYLDIIEKEMNIKSLTPQDVYKYIKNKLPEEYKVSINKTYKKDTDKVITYKNSVVNSVDVEFLNERYVELTYTIGTSMSNIVPNYGNTLTNTVIYEGIKQLLKFMLEKDGY